MKTGKKINTFHVKKEVEGTNKHLIRKILILFIMLLLGILSAGAKSNAASKTMTGYNEILKSGNHLYCVGDTGIYKVNLKNNKVTTLVRHGDLAPVDVGVTAIKIKGSYLYYLKDLPMSNILYSVHISTGRIKRLAGSLDDGIIVTKYAISGSKIYYYQENEDNASQNGNYVMNLDGSGKKKTGVKCVLKKKKSNTKGKYKLKLITNDSYWSDYIQINGKSIFLGKCTM